MCNELVRSSLYVSLPSSPVSSPIFDILTSAAVFRTMRYCTLMCHCQLSCIVLCDIDGETSPCPVNGAEKAHTSDAVLLTAVSGHDTSSRMCLARHCMLKKNHITNAAVTGIHDMGLPHRYMWGSRQAVSKPEQGVLRLGLNAFANLCPCQVCPSLLQRLP